MIAISPYEITQKHYNEIAFNTTELGVDFDKLYPKLNFDDREITKGIELSKEYRGKVWAISSRTPAGYPIITIVTKGGCERYTFNGYAAEHQNDVDYKPLPIPKPQLQPKPPEPKKADALAKNHTLYATGTNDISSHGYVLDKGISFDGLEVKRVTTWRGDCLMIPMQTMQKPFSGYQFITDKPYFLNGKLTNKEINGEKGFAIIGGTIQDVIERGAWFGEGVATCAAVYNADSDGKETLSNAEKLPVVICFDAGNLGKVIDEFVTAGMNPQGGRIAADNDCGKPDGNTGLFVAYQISKKHGCTIYIPQRFNHETGKCDAVDFADTLEFIKGIALKNPTDYALELLTVAPKGQLRKLGQRAAFTIAKERVPSKMSAVDAIDKVNAILVKRGADVKKIGVDRIINNYIRKQKEILKKRHTITHKLGINRIQFGEGETNHDIAKHILESGAGIFLDNRGLGAGKTKLLEILREHLANDFIAYVCHRVSLTKDAAGRLSLLHYQNDDIAGDCHGAAICVNSMPKNHVAGRFNILFLDEFRQILEHVAKGTVENRQAVFDALVKAIELADLVICSDADLNDRCVNFLQEHAGDKQINLIETSASENPKVITVFDDFAALRADISENSMIACTSREQSKRVFKSVGDVGLLIHSKNADDELQASFLSDPNGFIEVERPKHLIHSPTVGSGVSIELEHFAVNYLFNSGNISSNECLQMLARNRMSNDYRVAFASQKNFDRVTDLDLLTEGEGLKKQNFMTEVKKGVWTANELGQLRIELTAERNDDLNNFANNFLFLAEIKGFKIEYQHGANAQAVSEKDLKKAVKAETIDAIFNAPVIDDNAAKTLKNSKKQADCNAADRHLTTVIAGTSDINANDVENVIYGKAISQVSNFELLQTNIHDLKQYDRENETTQNKTVSKTSLHKLGSHVIKELSKHNRIDRKIAQGLCDYLNDNAAEIAANGLGNYTRKTKNPLRTLGTFIEKFGYEFVECEQLGSNDNRTQTFKLRVIDYVSRYVENRTKQKGG